MNLIKQNESKAVEKDKQRAEVMETTDWSQQGFLLHFNVMKATSLFYYPPRTKEGHSTNRKSQLQYSTNQL